MSLGTKVPVAAKVFQEPNIQHRGPSRQSGKQKGQGAHHQAACSPWQVIREQDRVRQEGRIQEAHAARLQGRPPNHVGGSQDDRSLRGCQNYRRGTNCRGTEVGGGGRLCHNQGALTR